jgi:hypothetical protein
MSSKPLTDEERAALVHALEQRDKPPAMLGLFGISADIKDASDTLHAIWERAFCSPTIH